jgi:hypothetical protein
VRLPEGRLQPLDELAWKRMLQLYPKVGKATAEKSGGSFPPGLRPWTALDSKEMPRESGGAREGWRAP